MNKIKITVEQYNRLFKDNNKERSLVSETSNEVVVGVAKLAGLKVSGTNEIVADKALKDENTLLMIKACLEDEKELSELVKDMEEKGMKNVEAFLIKNVDKLIKNFNEKSNINTLDFITKKNIVDLGG